MLQHESHNRTCGRRERGQCILYHRLRCSAVRRVSMAGIEGRFDALSRISSSLHFSQLAHSFASCFNCAAVFSSAPAIPAPPGGCIIFPASHFCSPSHWSGSGRAWSGIVMDVIAVLHRSNEAMNAGESGDFEVDIVV